MDERDRFEELYRRHAGRVYAYARRRGHAAAEAEDVVAETFLIAWRRHDDVPPDPLPWLLGVARRVLANRRRGARRAEALVERLIGEAEVGRTAVAATELDLGALRALGSLSERDQELLMLIAWEGLSRSELATTLGISRGNVAVRVLRARRSFARALEAHRDPPGAAAVTRSGAPSSMEVHP